MPQVTVELSEQAYQILADLAEKNKCSMAHLASKISNRTISEEYECSMDCLASKIIDEAINEKYKVPVHSKSLVGFGKVKTDL